MLTERYKWLRLIAAAAALSFWGSGQAFVVDTGNPDWHLRWDNTIKYSAGWRVEGKEGTIANNPNVNDGDNNFDTGSLVTNRVDLLSELETDYKGWLRFRVSYAGWYDDVYRGNTDNKGVAGGVTYSALGRSSRKFPKATRKIMGRDGEVQDLLVQWNTSIAGRNLTLRLGKHAMFWGESLFFATVGVSGAMAPLDAIKATSVPNTQARELLLPINQTTGVFQLSDETTIEWFYQFEWEPTRIPTPGAFFSPIDFLPDIGGQALLLPPPAPALPVVEDHDPRDGGQFGLALRHYSSLLDADLGFYFVNHHQKAPPSFNFNAALLPLGPGGALVPVPVSLQPVYAEDIQVLAVSYSGFHLGMNVAGEVSYWHDAPLVGSAPALNLPGAHPFDTHDNPSFVLTDQLHAQVSFIRSLIQTKVWDGGTVLGEFALMTNTKYNDNRRLRDKARNDTAYGFRVLAQPQWYQVWPGVDLTGRLGLGFNFRGHAQQDVLFNGTGASQGGDATIGLDFDYKKTWFGGISYTNFFGSDEGGKLNQYLDRDFISINVKRTF